MSRKAPEAIGKYRVIRELGRGATGAVYLADDAFNKRQVAIKLMFPEALKDAADGEMYKRMFLTEASLAGKIIHPHIVAIHDAVVEDEMSYIVMEYIDGATLEQHCRADHLLDTQTVTEIIFKCVRALAFVNREGLIHRDLKPGNILHRGGSEIKVADFGAALNRVSDRTQIAAVGSPLYMAPELIAAARATVQSDIYSLGMVMYMLLAGRPPFAASNPASLAYQIVNHEPATPSQFRSDLPAAVEDIVKRAIAKDIGQRYSSWEAFGADLADLAQQAPAAKTAAAPQQARGLVSDTERFSRLKTLTFFHNFPENELWEVLKISKWRAFPPDTVLIKEGDAGDSFFIIAQGSAKVTRGKRLLNVLGAGNSIGEMSYLASGEGKRSASVTAGTECIIMKIRAADLHAASANCRQLFDRKFLDILVERLNTANQQLAMT